MERGEAEPREVILFRPAAARELAADVRYYDDRLVGPNTTCSLSRTRGDGQDTGDVVAMNGRLDWLSVIHRYLKSEVGL
jgi:hypothetical protein